MKTGGYEAEYGRSTGGIINVITKSGGNEFHGDVFGYHFNDSLQASSKSVVSSAGTVSGFTNQDFGADVGGYILKDKLWFFGAFDRVSNSTDSSTSLNELMRQPTESTERWMRPPEMMQPWLTIESVAMPTRACASSRKTNFAGGYCR